MMKEVKQAEWGSSRKDATLEVNTIPSSPVRKGTPSGKHWKKKKKPGSLLGDLRQALLESLPIFLKQLTWTAGPGGSSQDRQALAP